MYSRSMLHSSIGQGIDIENRGIEPTSIHTETVHPGINALQTSSSTNGHEFMLKVMHSLTVDDELRQAIVHIHETENRSVEEISLMSDFISSFCCENVHVDGRSAEEATTRKQDALNPELSCG